MTDRVHGLAGDLVVPDWPPLTDDEVAAVLRRFPELGDARGSAGGADARITWRSPRPMSAAALVGAGGRTVFVKRHSVRVRTPRALAVEHGFAAHLRGRGVPAPAVLTAEDGATTVLAGPWVYEVHERAAGSDRYRDVQSWTGFHRPADAQAAGEALGRLHVAAGGFDEPPRAFSPVADSCEITAAADPPTALASLVAGRPGLETALRAYPWREQVADVLGDALARASGALSAEDVPDGWTHGDWHPSNLTWTDGGQVAGVLDLGLANRTRFVRDLAIAIERACVRWLDPTPTGDANTVADLLAGYGRARTLTAGERAALAPLCVVAHVEFALSEVEYYGTVLGDGARAAIAYRDYLIGHARWWGSEPGRRLLEAVAGVAGTAPARR